MYVLGSLKPQEAVCLEWNKDIGEESPPSTPGEPRGRTARLLKGQSSEFSESRRGIGVLEADICKGAS